MIKVFDGQVRAALLHDGRMTLFAADAEYEYVPRELRDFVQQRTDFTRPIPPPGLVWVGKPAN